MSELLLPIGGGGGTSSDELTATKAQVLEGYTAVTKDSNDEAASGTMQNLTSKATKTYTSSNGTPVLDGYGLSLQTNSDGTKRIMIDSQYGGYIGAWTLFGVDADKLGGASQANVLNGQTFTSSNGIKLSGTMQNLTNQTTIQYTSDNATKVIAGDAIFKSKNTDNVDRVCIRYNGVGGYITRNTLFGMTSSSFGNATAAQVLSGKTFTSTAGIKVSGTIASLGGQTITPSSSQQTVSCSGKYMTGNIVINAVPSSYLSPGSWTVFNDGAFSSWLGWAPYQYSSTALNYVSHPTTTTIAKNNTLIKGLFFYLNRLFPTAHLKSVRLIGQSINTRDTYHTLYVVIGTKETGGYKTVILRSILDATFKGDEWKSFDVGVDLSNLTSYGSEVAIGFAGRTTTYDQMKLSKIVFTMK